MAYINANSEYYGMRVQYSTLSDYVDATRAAYSSWPVRQYDFLPYAGTSAAASVMPWCSLCLGGR
jgi:hypothetical protein